MNRNTIIFLALFLLSLLAGLAVETIFLQKKIRFLQSQLSERVSFYVRYGTIEKIDPAERILLFRYKSAFGKEDSILEAKIAPFALIEEQNPVYAGDVIVRLEEPREIALEELRPGDTAFIRFTSKGALEALYIRRGIPVLP